MSNFKVSLLNIFVESDNINILGTLAANVSKKLVDKYEQTGRSTLLLKIQRDEEISWVTIKFIN